MRKVPSFLSRPQSFLAPKDVDQFIRDLRKWLMEQIAPVVDDVDGLTAGAPVGAQYLVLALHSDLTAERRFDPETKGFIATDNGANADYDFALRRAASRFYQVDHMWNDNTTDGNGGVWGLCSTSGTAGASVQGQLVAGKPGVVRFATGTNAAGRAGWEQEINGSNSPFSIGGGVQWTVETSIRITETSTGTQRFRVLFGFTDTDGTISNNGCFFEYKDDVNSGKWQIRSRNGGVESTKDSGVTVTFAAWITLKLVFASDGSSVEGFINGTSIGTLSTNIPASSNYVFLECCIQKTVGTTSRTMDCDYVEMEGIF